MAAVLALIALRCAVSAWAIHAGFSHVSDDDYARVTIAQAFARAPRLDPSGTSWLPFPFWLTGATMALVGRGLGVARAVAIASGIVGALAVHRALLEAGVARWVAWCGVSLVVASPWEVWLGVATVPEALAAAFIAAASLTLAADRPGARVLGGVMVLVACLSRYEAWPVAAVFAVACGWRAVREGLGGRRPRAWREAGAAALAVLGPCAWLLWNAQTHGDALHFLARVTAYRARVRALDEAPDTTGLWLYPTALIKADPWAVGLGCLGSAAMLIDRDLRLRWSWPLLAMASLVAFLVVGDLHDGAPTHHPVRPLLPLIWVGTALGIDGARSLASRLSWGHPKREAWLVGGVTAVAIGWALTWPARIADYPGRSAAEDRGGPIAVGRDLRARGIDHVTLTPCAYEHFALIAAFEAPERVTIMPASSGAWGQCPHVEER